MTLFSSSFDLQHAWQTLLVSLAVPAKDIDELYVDLCRHYDEPQRYYHNLEHIKRMWQTAEKMGEGVVENMPALLLAIAYHDIIYDPKAKDNEQQSALYARKALSSYPNLKSLLPLVEIHILVTQHQSLPTHQDSCFLVDIDLETLAAPPEIYQTYQQAIRQEYSYVPDALYRIGRQHVLTSFLQRERIYLTATFTHLEEIARRNLVAECQLLQN